MHKRIKFVVIIGAQMKLTVEQLAIVNHDLNSHAKVLAVAGAGKTSTMVERISHLVKKSKIDPKTIRVVMFNKNIRKEFEKKLAARDVVGVKVNTFHSLGLDLCKWAVKKGLLKSFTVMEDDSEKEALIKAAIDEVLTRSEEMTYEDKKAFNEKKAEHIDNIKNSIEIWKGMMTPPNRARHLGWPIYSEIYLVYEILRNKKNSMTFDDMIYGAVELLEQNKTAQSDLINRLEHIIVDEFQDVNYSKLRLIQLLAGTTAKMMVVGDDDQCIYEWIGANPIYLRRGFHEIFTSFSHTVYGLSRSFRFGSKIAQTAANCISRNTDREVKALIASDVNKPSFVELNIAEERSVGKDPVEPILRLIEDGVPLKEIAVIVRSKAQSSSLQNALFANKIPFYFEGEANLLNSNAIKLARDYLAVVAGLNLPLNEATRSSITSIINRPKRYVNVDPFRSAANEAFAEGKTPYEFLSTLKDKPMGININCFPHILKFIDHLKQARLFVGSENDSPNSAGLALSKLVELVDFKSNFNEFQTKEKSDGSIESIKSFIKYLLDCNITLSGINEFIKNFDTMRGEDLKDNCIKIATIHKEKGREYDYVILPEVVEGALPNTSGDDVNQATDSHYPERWPAKSSLIERERRLFYVAITRAKKAAFIFSSNFGNKVSRFIHESFVNETSSAIDAINRIKKSNSVNPADLSALRLAAGHGTMKDGLVSILHDSALANPAIKETLASAVTEVSITPKTPFRYPEAYPDQVQTNSVKKSDAGLPF